MAYNYEYPYTDPHRYNDDWMLQTIKILVTEWRETRKDWEKTQESYNELQSYVENYFKNIDYTPIVAEQLQTLINDGTLERIINEEIFGELSSTVEQLKMENDNMPVLNVKNFGAVGDGVHDDTEAIQAAIDSLPNGGGIVLLPCGSYIITNTLQIGNGDNGALVSKKQGIKLIGTGGGFGQVSGSYVPTMIRYRGAEGAGTVAIKLNGRISDVVMSGFHLYCDTQPNAAIMGLSFSGCKFENIKITNPKKYGIFISGGDTLEGNYCINNHFENIFIALLTDDSVGINITGHPKYRNDMWLSTFIRCRVESHADSCIGLYLGYQDSCTFIRCHFVTYSTNYIGVWFNGNECPDMPCGNCFHDCSIHNTKVTGTIRDQIFINFGTYDNEEIPTHPNLKGITDRGVAFNGWGGNNQNTFVQNLNIDSSGNLVATYVGENGVTTQILGHVVGSNGVTPTLSIENGHLYADYDNPVG